MYNAHASPLRIVMKIYLILSCLLEMHKKAWSMYAHVRQDCLAGLHCLHFNVTASRLQTNLCFSIICCSRLTISTRQNVQDAQYRIKKYGSDFPEKVYRNTVFFDNFSRSLRRSTIGVLFVHKLLRTAGKISVILCLLNVPEFVAGFRTVFTT